MKEAKEIQKALTIAEKALTSQNWQAKLFIELRVIKDGKPITYQATKTQVDRAIQHLENLYKSQKQEPVNEQNRSTNQRNSEENRFTTGQKVAIAFGIIGGVILVGVIISQVIKSKKKQNK